MIAFRTASPPKSLVPPPLGPVPRGFFQTGLGPVLRVDHGDRQQEGDEGQQHADHGSSSFADGLVRSNELRLAWLIVAELPWFGRGDTVGTAARQLSSRADFLI